MKPRLCFPCAVAKGLADYRYDDLYERVDGPLDCDYCKWFKEQLCESH